MVRKRILFAWLAAAGLAAPAAGEAACLNADSSPPRITPTQASEAVVCLMNERRLAAGVRGLTSDARLQRAAQRHSKAMDAANFFAHESAMDGSPLARIRATGYFAGAVSWGFAENIHWGKRAFASPRRTVARWMASPPHRASLLSGRYRQVGVGIAIGAPVAGVSKAAIYTADFGYRR
jgi:uncharacterized protein YkwD